jgi:hypothetical protein
LTTTSSLFAEMDVFKRVRHKVYYISILLISLVT